MSKPTVLVAEDESALVTLLRYNLEREGYRVLEARDGEEALLVAAEEQPDYLSGLLIGHELCGLAALLESRGATLAQEAPRLIGSAALCERYRLALAEFGCTRASVVEAAAESGLWRIATQAGLVERHATAPAS